MRGVRIGHYTDLKGVTGCTVFLFDDKAVCSYSLLGNAAGTKELTPLEENHIVEKIDGICISGGSAFGLDASSGVMRYLEERGKGFDAGIVKVPIVPSAIIFDLAIGDFKARPNERDGYTACENAKEEIPERGSVGAGTGATVGKVFGMGRAMKGGFGFGEIENEKSVKVEAYAVVNAFGDILSRDERKIIAGALSEDRKGFVNTADVFLKDRVLTGFLENTVVIVVLTDAKLSKAECRIISKSASAGLYRVVNPAATIYDGDIIFTVSVGNKEKDLNFLSVASASAVETAVLDAVFSAKGLAGIPSYSDLKS